MCTFCSAIASSSFHQDEDLTIFKLGIVLARGPVDRVLKICTKFTGEHPSRKAILIKLQSNFIKITSRHGCSPVNLLHILRTLLPNNTSRGLLLTNCGLVNCLHPSDNKKVF